MATTARLVASGFVDIECWLQPSRPGSSPASRFETFLRTVILGPHLDRLPSDERDAFVHEVAERLARAGRSTTSGSTSSRRAAERGSRRAADAGAGQPPVDPECRAVAGDDDVGGGRGRARAARRAPAWSGGERVDLGRPVGSPPEVGQGVDRVVGLDDERRVLLGVAGRQPQLGCSATRC